MELIGWYASSDFIYITRALIEERTNSTGSVLVSDRSSPPHFIRYSSSTLKFSMSRSHFPDRFGSYRYWKLNPGQDEIMPEQSPVDPVQKLKQVNSQASRRGSRGSQAQSPRTAQDGARPGAMDGEAGSGNGGVLRPNDSSV